MADLYLYDAIGSSLYNGISDKDVVAQLDEMKNEPVTVRINSPGGDVFQGFSIYQALQRHPHPVYVQIDALAASIASVIALAGRSVQIAEGGMFMIHSGWTTSGGNKRDLRKTADLLDKVDANIASVYAARTGQAEADIAELMDDETWFSAAEAVEFGFADGITEGVGQSAAALTKQHLELFSRVPAQIAAMATDGEAGEATPEPETDATGEKWALLLRRMERGRVKTY